MTLRIWKLDFKKQRNDISLKSVQGCNYLLRQVKANDPRGFE